MRYSFYLGDSMAKDKTTFICGECGCESPKWMGKCPDCGSWNTMVEQQPIKLSSRSGGFASTASRAVKLSQVQAEDCARINTGIGELDRVLGGGVVPGSVVLISGEPGIGKSTLVLQAASELSKTSKVLYVSGEESAAQLRLRAQRIGVDGDMLLLCETDLEAVIAEIERISPAHIIIDSIQTQSSPRLTGAAGSVGQIREATAVLTGIAKSTGASIYIVGHVTKEGAIAGPKLLEHMVDVVLYFEGGTQEAYRLLRAAKNRYGSTDEIGVFEMTSRGMEEVADSSRLFLSGREAAGTAITCAIEGTRPMLVEVQSLIARTSYNNPRRMASGIDQNRLALTLAVLEKRAGLSLYDKDVYVNVVGGLKLNERAGDLALALCIASCANDKPLIGTAAIGELSLTGEIRPVQQMERRILECRKLGIKRVIIPEMKLNKIDGIELAKAAWIGQAMML